MTKEEIKALEAEFHRIRQSNIELHHLLSEELAKRFEKDKNNLDKDGFLPCMFAVGAAYLCTGWRMKDWANRMEGEIAATVMQPIFRFRPIDFPTQMWLHDLGPSETLSVLGWVLNGGDSK